MRLHYSAPKEVTVGSSFLSFPKSLSGAEFVVVETAFPEKKQKRKENNGKKEEVEIAL